jgi:DNA-directed RNA polymerase subunit RPC12/RpoP
VKSNNDHYYHSERAIRRIKMDNVYKCPKCSADLKEIMGLQLSQIIKNLMIMQPEILDSMEIKCWKCGDVTTASNLVKIQGAP